MYGSEHQGLLDLVDSVCKQNISTSSLSIHCCRNASFRPIFDALILRPSPGNIEMNMVKCLLTVLWTMPSKVSAQFGFRSPKLQDVVKKGIDHHQSKNIHFSSSSKCASTFLFSVHLYIEGVRKKQKTIMTLSVVAAHTAFMSLFYVFRKQPKIVQTTPQRPSLLSPGS